MRARRTVIFLLLVALAGALVAAQVQGCEVMDGGHHALMGCPTGILPVPLVLGLIALAIVAIAMFAFREKLVLFRAYHPPR